MPAGRQRSQVVAKPALPGGGKASAPRWWQSPALIQDSNVGALSIGWPLCCLGAPPSWRLGADKFLDRCRRDASAPRWWQSQHSQVVAKPRAYTGFKRRGVVHWVALVLPGSAAILAARRRQVLRSVPAGRQRSQVVAQPALPGGGKASALPG